jgi:hypothetical protein
MAAKPQPEQSTQEEQIRAALNAHWHACAAGDANAEHDIYDNDAICDYLQSGERILGQSKLQARTIRSPPTSPVLALINVQAIGGSLKSCPHQP